MVVIESKLHEGQPDWQSRHINAAGVRPRRAPRRADVGWHQLLERWLRLMELEALTPAERLLLDDFFLYAEEYFAWLLPFTTLRRAGDSSHRRWRRMRTLLAQATRLEVREAHHLHALLPGAASVQRVALEARAEALAVALWPGELKPQAQHLYGDMTRVQRLAALAEEDGWQVRPNPHVSYFKAPAPRRWYLTSALSPSAYLRQWGAEDLPQVGAHGRDELERELWPWLLKRGYGQSADRPGLERLLATRHERFFLRPGVEVIRYWDWDHAQRLDEEQRLEDEIAQAIDRVLSLLDEPLLAQMRAGDLA